MLSSPEVAAPLLEELPAADDSDDSATTAGVLVDVGSTMLVLDPPALPELPAVELALSVAAASHMPATQTAEPKHAWVSLQAHPTLPGSHCTGSEKHPVAPKIERTERHAPHSVGLRTCSMALATLPARNGLVSVGATHAHLFLGNHPGGVPNT